MEIVTNFLYQIIFTVGVVAAFGLVIALCRRAFCKIVGKNANKILLITGYYGQSGNDSYRSYVGGLVGYSENGGELFEKVGSNVEQ